MIELCVQWRSVDLIMVVTDFDATKGRPAKLHGPMEDCYPAEPAEAVINDGYLILDIDYRDNSPRTPAEIMINNQLSESKRLFDHILEDQEQELQELMFDELEDMHDY